jgi:hypothetical protein
MTVVTITRAGREVFRYERQGRVEGERPYSETTIEDEEYRKSREDTRPAPKGDTTR